MPGWAETILWVSAVAGGLAILWRVVGPLLKFLGTVQRMLPVLTDLTATFEGVPHAFAVLDEIVSQLRTDSGSSLLDIVKRLEQAALNAAEATLERTRAEEALAVGVEVARQLADQDRRKIDELMILLDRVTLRTKETSDTAHRLEQGAAEVASDLAASQEIADATEGPDGAAADAASRTTK